MSYPAWEVEEFVRGQLAAVSTWTQLLTAAGQPAEGAAIFKTLWQSLDVPLQRRLLPMVVKSVQFNRKNAEIRITYNHWLTKIISQAL